MFDHFKNLSAKRRLTAVLLMLLILLSVIFIWSNSLQNPDESMKRSNMAEKVVKPVIMALPVESWHAPGMITYITRKLGHFSEYLILGIELMALMIVLETKNKRGFLILWGFAVIIAALDESIQLTNGRGAMAADVLLDSFGAFCGLSLTLGISKLASRVSVKGSYD